jgi:hypothetical protein
MGFRTKFHVLPMNKKSIERVTLHVNYLIMTGLKRLFEGFLPNLTYRALSGQSLGPWTGTEIVLMDPGSHASWRTISHTPGPLSVLSGF